MNRILSFDQYRNKYLLTFYRQTARKHFLYKGVKVDKFEVFSTLYNRYLKGNSIKEIDLVISGMSHDFTLVSK
ncbi:MAG: hypothetical protein WC389_17170 [Lutibacter sp.]